MSLPHVPGSKVRDKIALAAATADWVGLDCQASCFSVLMVKRILSQSDHPRAPIMFAVAISIVPLCSVVKMLQVLRCPRSAILDQKSLMSSFAKPRAASIV